MRLFRPSFVALVVASGATTLALALGLLALTIGGGGGREGVGALRLSGWGEPRSLAAVPARVWLTSAGKTPSAHAAGHSSHTCVEADRACVVRHVCLSADGETFRYFVPPNRAFLAPNTTLHALPPPLATSGRRGSPHAVRFEATTLPPPRASHEADWVEGVTVLVHSAVPNNAGHVIGDDIFPAFNVLLAFGLLGGDRRWTGSDAVTIAERSLTELSPLQLRVFEQWHALSPNGVLLVRHALESATRRGRQLCFREIATGLDAFGYSNRDAASGGKGYLWLLFRQITLERWGVGGSSSWQRYPLILVVEKSNKRHITNRWDLVRWIREAHPEAEVQLVVWDDLEMRDQVALAARASVMVGVPGTSVFNAFLMPPGACLVTLCQVIAGVNNCGNEKEVLWDHFAHLRQRTYTDWDPGDLNFHTEILESLNDAQRNAVLAGDIRRSGDSKKYWLFWGSTDVHVQKDRIIPLISQCLNEPF